MKNYARYFHASVLSYSDNLSRNASRNVIGIGGILNRKDGVRIGFDTVFNERIFTIPKSQ